MLNRDKNGRFIKGHKHLKETKDKIGKAMTGKPSPMKGKIPWNKGKKFPRKWKDKMVNRKEYSKKYMKERRKNPKRRLNHNISVAICKALKGKKAGRHWEDLVGYTLQDLMKRLEDLFDENMNWENQGSYWEIDHIKPKSLFEYKSPKDSEFKKCWALSNLQPLEKNENRRKYNCYKK